MSCTPDVMTTADLEKFRTAVHRKCRPFNLSYDDREEVVSDILLAAVRASKSTGIPVVKLAFSQLKRGRFFTRPAQRAARYRAELAEPDIRDDGSESPSPMETATAVSHEEHLELQDLIDRLPLVEKRVFVLCTGWKYTLTEAAAALGIPVSTAHLRLARARGRLVGGWLMAQAV